MSHLRKKIIAIFPDVFVLVVALIVPIALAVFFYVKQYSSHLYDNNVVAFKGLEVNWISRYLSQFQWVDWLNRFVDFAFWGVCALIIILIIWAIASVEIAVENHYATEDFVNFKEDKVLWHQKFYTVLIIKVMLIAVAMYSIVAFCIRYIPQLSVSVDGLFTDTSLNHALLVAGRTCLIMTVYILVAVTSIRAFMRLRSD